MNEEDRVVGEFFKKAEKELKDIAKKYGFYLRLAYGHNETEWFFYPELPADWGYEKL